MSQIATSKTWYGSGWKREGMNLIRGTAGGLIFGMPLLYTMEIWWHGVSFTAAHLLVILGVTLVLNTAFSLLWGLREDNEGFLLAEAIVDAISAVGLSIVVSTLILLLIHEISLTYDGLMATFGKIAIEAAVVSIGITFTSLKFGGGEDKRVSDGTSEAGPRRSDERSREIDPKLKQLRADLKDFAATVAGAIVFASNVAPTEEIIMIAAGLGSERLLILLFAQLLICYVILFASGFEKHEVYVKDSIFQSAWAETIMAVAVALLTSAGLIYLIGVPHATGSWSTFLSTVVVLGLPAVVGGAGGRVVV